MPVPDRLLSLSEAAVCSSALSLLPHLFHTPQARRSKKKGEGSSLRGRERRFFFVVVVEFTFYLTYVASGSVGEESSINVVGGNIGAEERYRERKRSTKERKKSGVIFFFSLFHVL